ncbi:hypothetical protein J8273_4267 [Carpediemonas membranifera]|nr:hypothetical protein J8273_4264 [Carpediemonas membranifera]KAG9394164.1 hypothetical protein J8273_4266 [Carpediemonas membranifera]KAG9394165.1 hypothetical protein J8273_4267 [Carpediemonas membranifera]|eukprot:KAG9394162.1 hypothetical protein J8273_4264 [Carpediemonas membranifera]
MTKSALLLFLLLATVLAYRTAQVNMVNSDTSAYSDDEFSYFFFPTGSEHKAFEMMMGVRTIATNDVTMYYYSANFNDIDSDETKVLDVDKTVVISNAYNAMTGAVNTKSDKAAATAHVFARSAVDKIVSLNYDGTQLAETTITDRTSSMPMFCLDDYLYVCTQVEMLKYNLNLELQANVSIGTSGYTYSGVLPYNKNGVSMIAVGSDSSETVAITSVNTAFSAIVSTYTTTDIEEIDITDMESRLMVTKEVSDTKVHYGVIDYDADSNTWVWTHEAYYENTDVPSASISISDDHLNGVVALTTTVATGTSLDNMVLTYGTSLTDAELNPIDGTEMGGFSYSLDGTLDNIEGINRVYEDVLMYVDMKSSETDNTETTILKFHYADSAAWVRAGLLAILLALVMLA